MARSASASTSVLDAAVLSDVSGSTVVAVMIAEFTTDPVVAGSTVARIVNMALPETSSESRLQVTARPELLHSGEAELKSTPVGSVSETIMVVAVDGPLLVMVRV